MAREGLIVTLTEFRQRRALAPNRDTKSIFVTGGIGDVIALSCFLAVPVGLETIYYATPKFGFVSEYLRRLCPEAEHVSLWDNWSSRECFYSLPQFQRDSGSHEAADADDWSILTVFHRPLTFRGWPLSPTSLPRSLPKRYAVLAPFTTDKSNSRDFTAPEIAEAISVARRNAMPLVVLNHGEDAPLEGPGIINLQNQTTLLESIAVTRSAEMFIGVDSSMSVVASKTLPANRLLIKSSNPHCLRWQHIYFAPHRSFDFITDNPIRRMKEKRWTA